VKFKATKPEQILRAERWADGSRMTPLGTRRRIECRIAPSSVIIEDMAPGQPSRFEFTERGQAVDLVMADEGYRVLGMTRGGHGAPTFIAAGGCW